MNASTYSPLAMGPETLRPPVGKIKLGSQAHKALFCDLLLKTHDPYDPADIDWPELDDVTRDRIVSLPIWDIAVQTEGKAGLNVKTYAEVVADPLLKAAIAVNAFEESRHKVMLADMVAYYDIPMEREREYQAAADPEWAYMVTGYSECIDSFFGFGLFDIARKSGFFPPALVDLFDPVMREEGRHILFFVNWVAWRRRNMPLWRRLWFDLKVLAVWAFLIWERLGIALDLGDNRKSKDHNFTFSGSKTFGGEITFAKLARTCLLENDRRLALYDGRLIRPLFIPNIIRLFLKLAPLEKASAARRPAG